MPSQLPDFSDYEKSRREQSNEMIAHVGKLMRVNSAHYYEDMSEDEDEIGVAKTADAKIAVKAATVRTVYIKTVISKIDQA